MTDKAAPRYDRDNPPPVATRRGKPSAIVTGRDLDRARPHVERAAAIALLALSVAGAAVAFGGGWPAALAARWEVLALGAVVQLVCTLIEWLYRHNRRAVPYLVAFGVDAGTTVAGLGPIAAPTLTSWLAPFLPLPEIAAWAILVVLACALAWVPEGRLVDD